MLTNFGLGRCLELLEAAPNPVKPNTQIATLEAYQATSAATIVVIN